jgi:hypothetical protein
MWLNDLAQQQFAAVRLKPSGKIHPATFSWSAAIFLLLIAACINLKHKKYCMA